MMNSQQTGEKRNILNLINGMYKKPTADIILNGRNVRLFS